MTKKAIREARARLRDESIIKEFDDRLKAIYLLYDCYDQLVVSGAASDAFPFMDKAVGALNRDLAHRVRDVIYG
ncbi:MAG TPA: hypothetical protein VJN96_12900 [Vicinamibacterales bacterium]|nr:hypothetical protein [Vicinamibacterales bacterium]